MSIGRDNYIIGYDTVRQGGTFRHVTVELLSAITYHYRMMIHIEYCRDMHDCFAFGDHSVEENLRHQSQISVI